ncbi:DEAD/DEAH box helicase [Basilea psittacipulmonis]|uniref:DEAD/DEAH box helicase n=1 Tax=Basilea psittacipulmonis TaxID=1472345 RepID=UPI0006904988|nr:DEAD/DEAH box helicase [Basilea psittacipulmonis]
MTSFESMGLPEALLNNLKHIKFTQPTPIQAQAIPLVLAGHDVLGSAQTGTGKTGAFGIPLVSYVMKRPTGTALVLTPTRELALQVHDELKKFLGKKIKIATALLIGGESMPKQISQLKRQARVIVGTPGRVNDHIKRGSLKLFDTQYLVLDETDRMLDMGFVPQIDEIIQHLPKHQTLLFSATFPKSILELSKKYLNQPKEIAVDPVSSVAKKIEQENRFISSGAKFDTLLDELANREGSMIIFTRTKNGADRMAQRLFREGYKAFALHGDLPQSKRQRVVENYRKGKFPILVATDIAARGLDISHVNHVINYDLPQCPEDYVHRIGRTARAGANGFALNLITPTDEKKWAMIERLLNPEQHSKSIKTSKGRHAGTQPKENARKNKTDVKKKTSKTVEKATKTHDAAVAKVKQGFELKTVEKAAKTHDAAVAKVKQGFELKTVKTSKKNIKAVKTEHSKTSHKKLEGVKAKNKRVSTLKEVNTTAKVLKTQDKKTKKINKNTLPALFQYRTSEVEDVSTSTVSRKRQHKGFDFDVDALPPKRSSKVKENALLLMQKRSKKKRK